MERLNCRARSVRNGGGLTRRCVALEVVVQLAIGNLLIVCATVVGCMQ